MICASSKKSEALLKYKFIDLFAGIGGFRTALEEFGAKCVFSSEWDQQAAKVYCENFGELPSGDLTKIHAEDIPRHSILCAGFPCQPFSISGKQKGFEDTRGTLFYEVERIIKFHMPKVVILENVKNFVTHDKGKTIAIVLKTLQASGYTSTFKVLNAGDYGVPQKRERVFIVATNRASTSKAYIFPTQQQAKVRLEDIIETQVDEKYYIKRNDYIFNKTEKSKTVEFFCDDLIKPYRIGICNKGGQGERIYSLQGHAITLSAYGGGAGAKTGLYLVGNKVRKLIPRECARLMGFPETFKIHKSDSQAYKQFGNSVVVDVVKAIVKSLIEQKIL
jgi:DNA (cytosine-5)-methyltransferase 1